MPATPPRWCSSCSIYSMSFDLLYVDGEDLMARPLIDRKTRLAGLLSNVPSSLHYCDHQIGRGREFHKQACAMSLEGIVSKRADAAYMPGNRGLWLKVKCLSGIGTELSNANASARRRVKVSAVSDTCGHCASASRNSGSTSSIVLMIGSRIRLGWSKTVWQQLPDYKS